MKKLFSEMTISRTRGKIAEVYCEEGILPNGLWWVRIGNNASLWGPYTSFSETRLMLDRLEVGPVYKDGRKL